MKRRRHRGTHPFNLDQVSFDKKELPLDDKICLLSSEAEQPESCPVLPKLQHTHRIIQSVGATGGVYKDQGRNQRKLVTCAY